MHGENAQSTLLFCYCSGGRHERNEKYFCPALDMEASKEEYGSLLDGWGCRNLHNLLSHVLWQTLYIPDECARVAEEVPHRTHITARLQLGIGPSNHYALCDCVDKSHEEILVQVGSMRAIIKDHLQILKFVCNGLRIKWLRHKRLTEWLHVWAIGSGSMRKMTAVYHRSALRSLEPSEQYPMKQSAWSLAWRQSIYWLKSGPEYTIRRRKARETVWA